MDWDSDPQLAALLHRMTCEDLIGWHGSIGSPERAPFLRTHGREALAILRVLDLQERSDQWRGRTQPEGVGHG